MPVLSRRGFVASLLTSRDGRGTGLGVRLLLLIMGVGSWMHSTFTFMREFLQVEGMDGV